MSVLRVIFSLQLNTNVHANIRVKKKANRSGLSARFAPTGTRTVELKADEQEFTERAINVYHLSQCKSVGKFIGATKAGDG